MLFKRKKLSLPELPYNIDALEFLIRNGISEVDISKITESINEPKDIDSILEEKALTTEEKTEYISIADIIGYESPRKKDIFESLNEFFDSEKDGYHTRSLSMLEYTPDNVMSGLSRSFIAEPMKVREVKPGCCFITSNGMHRFTILRIMFLIEKYRGKNIDDLKTKYTIPVIFNRVDKVKTYCSYIISVLNENIIVRSEIDENYHKTDRVEVKNRISKTISYLTDEELIIFTTELIRDNNLDIQTLIRFSNHIEKNSSFYNFLKIYFNDLLTELEKFIEYKKSCKTTADLYEYKLTKNKEDKNTWTI